MYLYTSFTTYYAAHSLQYTIHSLQCGDMFIVSGIYSTSYCKWYVVHRISYIVYCILYALYISILHDMVHRGYLFTSM